MCLLGWDSLVDEVSNKKRIVPQLNQNRLTRFEFIVARARNTKFERANEVVK